MSRILLLEQPFEINHLVIYHLIVIVQHPILSARNYGGTQSRFVRKAAWDFRRQRLKPLSHHFFSLLRRNWSSKQLIWDYREIKICHVFFGCWFRKRSIRIWLVMLNLKAVYFTVLSVLFLGLTPRVCWKVNSAWNWQFCEIVSKLLPPGLKKLSHCL